MEITYNKESINEDSLLNEEVLITKPTIWFNIGTQSEEVSIEDLKDKIENSSLLNYPYQFLSLDGSKEPIPPVITINFVDNINVQVSEDIFEHYNKQTGQITITEKLLFNDVILPSSFPECLYSSVGQSKLLMFAILHEVGHALHHQIYLKQDNYLITSKNDFNHSDFLNLIADNGLYLLGRSNDDKKYDLNHAIKYSIKEGFADLYACIGLLQIYPQEVALNFIHEVIEAREISNNNYYTTESIKHLKKDIENNNLNLTNFEDLHNYIDKIISNTALKTMLEKLSSDNEEQIKHNNAFAGFLKSVFEKSYEQGLFNENLSKQANSSLDIIKVLELDSNELNINISNNFKEDSKSFNQGYEIGIQQINEIDNKQFLNSNHLTKPLHKILSIRNHSLKQNNFTISANKH